MEQLEQQTGTPVETLQWEFARQVACKLLEKKVKDLPDPEPGKYEVSGEIQATFRATVKKSEPTMRTPTAEVPILITLALVLQNSGITRERSGELLVEAMTEAVNLGEKMEPAIQTRLKEIEEAKDRVKKLMKKLPKRSCRGALKVEGFIDIVGEKSTVKAV